MVATQLNCSEPGTGKLSASFEVRYKKTRPLSHELAIDAVVRGLAVALQSGLLTHHGPVGSEFTTSIICGRHADQVNSIVCSVLVTFTGAKAGEYAQYRDELESNIGSYLDEGLLDFSLPDHVVEHIQTNVCCAIHS